MHLYRHGECIRVFLHVCVTQLQAQLEGLVTHALLQVARRFDSAIITAALASCAFSARICMLNVDGAGVQRDGHLLSRDPLRPTVDERCLGHRTTGSSS